MVENPEQQKQQISQWIKKIQKDFKKEQQNSAYQLIVKQDEKRDYLIKFIDEYQKDGKNNTPQIIKDVLKDGKILKALTKVTDFDKFLELNIIQQLFPDTQYQESTRAETSQSTINIEEEEQKEDERLNQIINNIGQEKFNNPEAKRVVLDQYFQSIAPDITKKVTTGEKLTEDDKKKFAQTLQEVLKTGDPNKIQVLQLWLQSLNFMKKEQKVQGGGVPLSQPKKVLDDQRKSLNQNQVVNGAGTFSQGFVPPKNPQQYDMISGKILYTPEEKEIQYKKYETPEEYEAQKQKFLKEAFYTIRNLPPESKVKAERILLGLEHYYKIKKSRKKLEEELQKPAEEGQIGSKTKEERLKEIMEKYKTKSNLKPYFQIYKSQTQRELKTETQKQIDELKQKIEKTEQTLKNVEKTGADEAIVKFFQKQLDLYKNQLSAQQHLYVNMLKEQQVNPGPIVIRADEEEKKQMQDQGKKKEAEEIIQENVMINRFNDGVNQRNLTTTDLQDFRDPGAVYNDHKPDFSTLKPFLEKILEESAKEQNLNQKQFQFVKDILEKGEKDELYLLGQLNFLHSKFAEVPLTTKEQQKVRNESEEILRKVGHDYSYYPWNEKTIQYLQTYKTRYFNEKGEKVKVPYEHVSKKYLEQKQKEALKRQQLGKEQEEEPKKEDGQLPIKDLVTFVHQLVKYGGKIEGDLNLDDLNLENYKQKVTTVFTPAIKKIENNKFNFTAESAFRLRQC